MTDTKTLSNKTNELIVELEATQNTTCEFYKKVLAKLHSSGDKKALKDLLSSIVTSSKIKDFGGYNKRQSVLWDQMWFVANELRKEID